MLLKPVAVFEQMDPEVFRNEFYLTGTPVVIKAPGLAAQWPAYEKWNWDYFKKRVGHIKVPLYNNTKSDSYTPINKADDYKLFGDYLDMISRGPAGWRVFLFNIFDHAPELIHDFTWPEHLMRGFVKRYPMLFTGGESSITHMHFDIDLSHILHTQFMGKKRILLFPHEEKYKLYAKPFEVLSHADFSHFHLNNGNPDLGRFPALKLAQGLDLTLERGDTLFMPAGWWHHMEYAESGFAMSLRALQPSLSGKLKGIWNLLGMRTIDTVMKKTLPGPWHSWKLKKVYKEAERELTAADTK